RQTSPATPLKRSNLSDGWFLNRHAQQIAGVPLAWFVTALYSLADGRFLAALADAVVLAIKWDSTPTQAVSSAASWLKSDGANLVGALFTMVDTSSQSVGAYYYYNKKYSSYYNNAEPA
ncbi:hypothetical protein HHL08_23220, partial [Sphingobium sp. AR-3-1]|nr:hypothetical protein [Sphingobium psychrophilum]